MKGKKADSLSFSDHAKLDLPNSSPTLPRARKQRSQKRISMPALQLRGSLKRFERKNSKKGSVDDGIAALDSILQQSERSASSEGATINKAHIDQLVKLKESLENLEVSSRKGERQKKPKSASLVHRAYLNEDWGVNGNESDDDVLSNDEVLDGDTHSSTESSLDLEPTYKFGNNAGTGANVLFAFGAMPAAAPPSRKKLLMESRHSSSSFLQTTPRQQAKKNIRLQKLASRRLSSLTSKIQSHAPKEWYSILELESKKQLARLLSWENLAKWEFDIFEIARLTNGHPLLFMGWAILSSPYSQHVMEEVLLDRSERRPVPFELMEGYRFIDHFQIDQKKMTNFLRTIERDYFEENPYHNNTHAADVLQTLHSMLQGMGGVDALQPTNMQLFAVLLSAVIHDVGHPGYNNFFQQSSRSDIALCYNDQSVLENMHLALAFRKLLGGKKKETINIFARMEAEEIATCRKLMVEAVLGTDMSKHFQSVAEVKKRIASVGGAPNEETTWEILHYMMHAADISNGAKQKEIAIQWADRCLEEFFRQGDAEKKMGIPVSPLCDRNSVSRPESQSGFIEFIIKPTFEVLVGVLPQIGAKIIPVLDTNLAFWNSQIPQKVVDDLEQLRDDFEKNDGVLPQEDIPPPPPPLPLNGLSTISSIGQTWEDLSEELTEEFTVELMGDQIDDERDKKLLSFGDLSIEEPILEDSEGSNSEWSSSISDADSQSVYEC